MRTFHLALLLVLATLLSCQQETLVQENVQSPTLSRSIQLPPKTSKKNIDDKARSVIGRWEYEMQLLRNPQTGEIPEGAATEALKQAKLASTSLNLPNGRNSNDIVVNRRGPGNKGGRTRALAFDQRNANIILAGGVSSGVFRTTNGGTSWAKVSSNSEIHNATAIAQDPTTPNNWYYGTGELFGNSASEGGAFYLGRGMWRSTDNGATWTALGSTQAGSLETFDNLWDIVNRIAVHPITGHVYAAANNAIFRSTNDGASWSVVLGGANAVAFSEIIITPSGRLYAAFDGEDTNEGVYTSTTGNNGAWTKIAGSGAATNPAAWNTPNNYDRIVLAYAPSNENIVYALYDNNTSSNCAGTAAPEAELFRWDNGTNTWTNLSANLPDEAGCSTGNDPFSIQGGYDLCVAVKPDNANTVFVGGTNLYRSTNGFTSTAATTRIGGYNSPASYALYPNHHPDIHTLVFAPGDNDNLYTGTDGGVHRGDITAGNVSWTSLNNDYATFQYYHADLTPVKGDAFVMGGAQDNGTTYSDAGTTHFDIFGGDGVGVGVISTTPTTLNVLCGAQLGTFYRVQSPNFFNNIVPNGTSSSIFVTYFHLDQDNTEYLYYADGADLYRTRIASTISNGNITGNSNSGWQRLNGVNQGSNIRAMATSRNIAFSCNDYTGNDNDRKLIIGLEDGRIFRLNNPAFSGAGTAPTNITPAGASGVVFDISINPENDNEAMAVYTSYGVNSVYHTTNLNAASPNWTNVEGNGAVQVASARSCVVASDGMQTVYFVGTSTGLYCTTTLSGGSTNWTLVGANDIGFAVCNSMRYRPEDQMIVVGTHGNGLFMLDLQDVLKNTVELAPKAFLQGPLSGTTMNIDLANAGLLPAFSPDGMKSATSGVLAGAVDWVTVEIRDGGTGTTVVATQAGLLLPDGSIVDSDGSSPLKFKLSADNYHVAIQHRNHLAVMTANPIALE